MNCPKCNAPIPDADLVKQAASLLAKQNAGKPRPGARGLVRNPAGSKGKPKCTCGHFQDAHCSGKLKCYECDCAKFKPLSCSSPQQTPKGPHRIKATTLERLLKPRRKKGN